MPLINGYKYSCEPCIRGHRATSCAHTDRILIEVRKPGRPLESCGHKLDSCSCGRLQDLFSIGDTPLEEPFVPNPSIAVVTSPPASKPKPKSRARPKDKVAKKPTKKKPSASPAPSTSEAGETFTVQSPVSQPSQPETSSLSSPPTMWSPPLPAIQPSPQPGVGYMPYQANETPPVQYSPVPQGVQSRVEDIAMVSNPQTQQPDQRDRGQAYIRSQYISAGQSSGWRATR